MIRLLRNVASFSALVLSLALPGLAGAQNISIATGGTGGVYYPMGGGLSAGLSKNLPGMPAPAEVTGRPGHNPKPPGPHKP